MKTIKNYMFKALISAVVFVMAIMMLVSCGSQTYTVTFVIEDKSQTIEAQDGKVTLPSNPEKEYYEFRGWYTTSTYEDGTEFTKDTKVEQDITVYAYFAPIHVNISVNGGELTDIKTEDLATKTEEYVKDAESQNLTFDGWYIDSTYTTKYQKQDTDNLYAHYCATVTFDNGYETYDTLVGVGTQVSKPSNDDIVKFYMDSEDIFYVDQDGNDVDFTQPISTNTTITVLWKTPNLEFDVNPSTGNLYFKGFKAGVVTGSNPTMANFPILSIPGKVTYNGELKTVESFALDNATLDGVSYSFRKVIVNEGVKYISGISGGINCLVSEVSLPSTLEMVSNSFNNLPNLTAINLSSNTKIVINSFWKNNITSISTYDFDIEIPDSVINLAQVPTNLNFSNESSFKKVGNTIYQISDDNEMETLISSSNVVDKTLEVEEGVKYIQAGALYSSIIGNVTYIKLPSTWTNIKFNASADEYTFYIPGRDGSILYSVENSMTNSAKMIIDNLESVERVIVSTTAYPTDASSEIICGDVDGKLKPYTDSAFSSLNKVVFTGEVEYKTKLNVYVRATNRVSGEVIVKTITSIKSGYTALTRKTVLNAVGLYENNKYVILSETQFGEDYTEVYGTKVTCNQYIDIVFEDANGGYTYEKTTDSVIITGFDESTAIDDGNNLFKVVIPQEIEGLPVTTIKAQAFKDNTDISLVLIPSSVKVIDDEAFMNTTNLSTVEIDAGGLEEIGRSAFENSGFKSIKLPIANLKNIEPYAFKSKTLESFVTAKAEENSVVTDMSMCMSEDMGGKDPEVGTFGFVTNGSDHYGIFKVVNKSVEKIKSSASSTETEDAIVYDVEFLATAGGMTSTRFRLGASMRGYLGDANYAAMAKNAVVRFEMMEGSVYYLDNLANDTSTEGIIFGMVSKVHANAFTDMNEKFSTISEDKAGNKTTINKLFQLDETGNENFTYKYDVWFTQDMFDDESIFEDGWWNGITKSDKEYESKMDFVNYCQKMNSGVLWL